MKHKWHQEIKAWADGAEIEACSAGIWFSTDYPNWDVNNEFRIKPQPKEPQYLYVYKDEFGHYFLDMELRSREFVKKIRLEADDV